MMAFGLQQCVHPCNIVIVLLLLNGLKKMMKRREREREREFVSAFVIVRNLIEFNTKTTTSS